MNAARFALRIYAAAIFLLCAAVHCFAAEKVAVDLSLSPEWHEAIEPLKRMPVQDNGFIRTGYTLSGNYISAISGSRKVAGADAFDVVLLMLRDPEKARDIQLIKLSHPELVKLYGSARISANQWREETHREALIAMVKADQKKWLDPLNQIEYRAGLIEGIDDQFAILPRKGEWLTPTAAMRSGALDSTDKKILGAWSSFRTALAVDDAKAGAAAARELSQSIASAAQLRGSDISAVGLDYFYHSHQPFRNASVFYLFAALAYGAAMMLARPRLNWAGFALLAGGLGEQIVGIVSRWMLAGRAPTSNMYESFTFAIAGMVLIALVLEATRVARMAGLGAAVLGFLFMVIAHKSPIFDSQIRPLMPALQSSWLTYHVITIMLSYSAFALSFFVSILYLAKNLMGGDAGLLSRAPSLRSLDIFTYRIVGVGFPLLSLGIIFGAIWAATAWGRPWGFDPKETWSAITWLIYAIYLHVRYLGGWTGKRAAVLSVVGFLAVLFTYLGVNYLLPGLHSYV